MIKVKLISTDMSETTRKPTRLKRNTLKAAMQLARLNQLIISRAEGGKNWFSRETTAGKEL